MNIYITKERQIHVPQLIENVGGVDKMRKYFTIKVKQGDIVPMYFMDTSIAQTEKVMIDDWTGTNTNVEVVQIKKDLEWKIIYETHNASVCCVLFHAWMGWWSSCQIWL